MENNRDSLAGVGFIDYRGAGDTRKEAGGKLGLLTNSGVPLKIVLLRIDYGKGEGTLEMRGRRVSNEGGWKRGNIE